MRTGIFRFWDVQKNSRYAFRFVPSESAFAYFETLEGYLTSKGRPLAGHCAEGRKQTVTCSLIACQHIVSGSGGSIRCQRCFNQ
ncbi:hypothetical protein FQV39_04890 [Bosea sp. F3-2]|nr:hypothetical protein FQV39_04890 [Bosea sp. F3-2]